MMKVNDVEWKSIPNFSWYLASNTGQILDATENKLVKQYTHASGYKLVRVMNDYGEKKLTGVHRLVYQAFYGTFPKHLETNHKDEDKSNNNIENLEAITHIENCNYGTRNERVSKAMTGRMLSEAHKKRISKSLKGKEISKVTRQAVSKKLSKPVIQLTLDGKTIGEYSSITVANIQTGINHIGDVCRGVRKTAGGFIWRYQ